MHLTPHTLSTAELLQHLTVVHASLSAASHAPCTRAQYFKRIRQTKRYMAHTEDANLAVGDYVKLSGCRPLSKNKRFTVSEVLRKAN